jgi:hypothetical protein
VTPAAPHTPQGTNKVLRFDVDKQVLENQVVKRHVVENEL